MATKAFILLLAIFTLSSMASVFAPPPLIARDDGSAVAHTCFKDTSYDCTSTTSIDACNAAVDVVCKSLKGFTADDKDKCKRVHKVVNLHAAFRRFSKASPLSTASKLSSLELS